MKHKLKIDAKRRSPRTAPVGPKGYLWYVECSCGWTHNTPAPHHIDGVNFFGRSTWDAAFALGIAHQRNADLKERLTSGA